MAIIEVTSGIGKSSLLLRLVPLTRSVSLGMAKREWLLTCELCLLLDDDDDESSRTENWPAGFRGVEASS